MGHKFKISFSGTSEDTGLSYLYDLGFIEKVKDGVRGFKLLVGGGLGSQPRDGDVLYEFIETDKIIPLMESILHVFDRYGDRSKRAKARMKFLLKVIGLEVFVALLNTERLAFSSHSVAIDISDFNDELILADIEVPTVIIEDKKAYSARRKSNVFE